MRIHALLLISALGLFSSGKAHALDQNKKMGKPTKEEMTMTQYAPDPSAKAVVLWSDIDINFSIGPAYDRLIYSYRKRIKVLHEDGIEAGRISIPYYDIDDSNKIEEEITDLKVTTYNLIDGKVTPSVMNSEDIQKKHIGKDQQLLSFTAPDVKVGSVIEYEYKLHSAYYLTPHTWYVQGEYPVFLSEYTFSMPEWFRFSTHIDGSLLMVPTYSHGDFKCQHPHEGTMRATTNKTHFSIEQIPALEPSTVPLEARPDCARLEYDLRETRIPLQVVAYFLAYWDALYKRNGQSVFFDNEVGFKHFRYRLKDYLYPFPKAHGIALNMTYNYSWDILAETLYKDEDFGGCLNMKNPLAQEQQSLELTEEMSILDRVEKLRQLLLANYQWNGSYSIFAQKKLITNKKTAINMGSLNFIMLSMLRDAGIDATPVVMSRTSKRQMPSFVSPRYLNAMVLRIRIDNSSIFYLDPTSDNLPVTALPPEILFDEGISITQNGFYKVNTHTTDEIPLPKVDSEI